MIQTWHGHRVMRIIKTSSTGEILYGFDEDDGKHYKKTVYHFLLELIDENEEPAPARQEEENFENVWLTVEEALRRLTHDDSKDLLKKAVVLVTES